jgi:bifunctional non-homologous end joining protein LigD
LPKKDGVVRHVVCENATTLVYLANQAVITPHTWLSRIDKPNHPGQMIFDLDPSDGDFRAVCDAANVNLAQNEPQRLTTEVRKSKRQGRIFIDTERNAAPAYAVRPCDGAPVAAPLDWNELDSRRIKSDLYNIRSIFDRLKNIGDRWKDLMRQPQTLPRRMSSDGS